MSAERQLRIEFEGYHGGRSPVEGWRFLWAVEVWGFDHTQHCLATFAKHSRRIVQIKPGMLAETPIDVTLAPPPPGRGPSFMYICGVALVGGYRNNLHLALKPRANAFAHVTAYTGDVLTVSGAEAMPIPELPQLYNGMSAEFTTCRNFQWAVATFGWPKAANGLPLAPTQASKFNRAALDRRIADELRRG